MNDLNDVCGAGGGDVNSMTLDQLRANCQNFGQAFGLSTVEIVLLILAVLVGLFWLLAARQRAGADAGTVVGNTIEGALYAAIGCSPDRASDCSWRRSFRPTCWEPSSGSSGW
jgi:hypothetical protein